MDPDLYKINQIRNLKFNKIENLVVMDLADHNLKRAALGMESVNVLPEFEIMLDVDKRYKYRMGGEKYDEMKKEFEINEVVYL